MTKLRSRVLKRKGASSISSLIDLHFGTTTETVDVALYSTRLERVGKTACRVAQWHSNGN